MQRGKVQVSLDTCVRHTATRLGVIAADVRPPSDRILGEWKHGDRSTIGSARTAHCNTGL